MVTCKSKPVAVDIKEHRLDKFMSNEKRYCKAKVNGEKVEIRRRNDCDFGLWAVVILIAFVVGFLTAKFSEN